MTKNTLSAVEMLAKIVAFDTTSRNSNLPLVGFIRAWLDAHGVPFRLSHNADRTKANVHAVIGPVAPGGIAFSGHLDTVPVEGQTWSGDPYALRRQDGRLIGRGVCDMKGFVASVLSSVPDIVALKPVRPVHLFFTYDEEVGYHGVRRLVRDISESGLRPDSCVVGEPSGLAPVLSQKGRLQVRIRVEGMSVHSSAPHKGVNPLHAAALAMAWVADESRRLSTDGPFEPGFDPPCTTLQILSASSEDMPSSLPGSASFDIEWRNIPSHDPLDSLARLKKYLASRFPAEGYPVFHFETLLRLGPTSMVPRHPLALAVRDASGARGFSKVSYASEASVLCESGMDCLVCGPGDVAQAHTPDEWTSETQVCAAGVFVREVARLMSV